MLQRINNVFKTLGVTPIFVRISSHLNYINSSLIGAIGVLYGFGSRHITISQCTIGNKKCGNVYSYPIRSGLINPQNATKPATSDNLTTGDQYRHYKTAYSYSHYWGGVAVSFGEVNTCL